MLITVADVHRRRLLVALLERDPQEQGDLFDPEDLFTGEEDPERVKKVLHHTHLPKLEAARFIRWEHDTGRVAKGPRFEEIRPLLELFEAHADELPVEWREQ